MSTGDLAAKWRSFGWTSIEVDGHDYRDLCDTLSRIPEKGTPLAVIAKTIKGKGVSFAENNNAWHHSVLTQSQYKDAIRELDERSVTK
jgi:transketolase